MLFIILAFISASCAENRRNHHLPSSCPQPVFAPSVSGQKQCNFSDHCSKVECIVSSGGHKLAVNMKINECQEPLSATVTIKQNEQDENLHWSHTLKDGEKVEVPTSSKNFTGDLKVTESAIFIQVGLRKIDESIVNYTVTMVGHVTVYGKVNPVNVLLLQGEVPMWNRNNCSQYGVLNAGTNSPTKKISTEASLVKKQSHEKVENLLCPVVKFEDGTKCAVSNKCTKITCRSTNSSMDMVLIVDINQCSDPVTATVTVNSQAQKWSHMFKDGEESDLIVPKGAIVKVSLSAVLKRKDDHIYVKFIMLTTFERQRTNITLLESWLPQLSKCEEIKGHKRSSSSWFHHQPQHVKILVVAIPVISLLLVGIAVGFCFFTKRGGLCHPMFISRQGRNRVPMQPLVDEI